MYLRPVVGESEAGELVIVRFPSTPVVEWTFAVEKRQETGLARVPDWRYTITGGSDGKANGPPPCGSGPFLSAVTVTRTVSNNRLLSSRLVTAGRLQTHVRLLRRVRG